jgi:DUF4097 and DUF4098 domain-containing protein YvlB
MKKKFVFLFVLFNILVISEVTKVENLDLDDFTRLKVETHISDIIFNYSINPDITVYYYSRTNDFPNAKIRRDKQSVHLFEDMTATYKTFSLFKNFLSFNHNNYLDWSGEGRYLFYNDKKLIDLFLTTNFGEISVRDQKISENFSASSNLNNIFLNNIQSKNIEVINKYGNITLGNLFVEDNLIISNYKGNIDIKHYTEVKENLTINNESGDIEGYEIFSKRINIYNNSGRIIIFPKSFQTLEITTISGNIFIYLNSKDFNIQVSSSENSNIFVFGIDYKGSFSLNKDNKNTIIIKTKEGNVIIEDISSIE